MSESSHQSNLASLRSAVFITDPHGCVLQWSETATRLLGWEETEVLGHPWWSRLHAELQDAVQSEFPSDSSTTTCDQEYLVNHPSGRVFWIHVTYHRLTSPFAPSGGWIATCCEKPHDSPAGQQARQGDLQLEALMNAIHDAVITLDSDLRIVGFNPAAEKVFGYKQRDVLNQSSRRFPPLFSTLSHLLSSHHQSGAPLSRQPDQMAGQRASGQSFPMEATVSSLTLSGHRLYTIVLQDVTDQRQRQQAMAQSQKMLAIGALASGVAHDFNNILTAILSHLDLLSSTPDISEAARENLTYAQTSARRGAELVSRLLTFSRQTEGKREAISLQDSSVEVVAMLRRSIDRRIQIEHELVSQPLWLVEGDASQLMQVLMNLCINARDAMPEGGTITVRLENVVCSRPEGESLRGINEFVKLTVADTGQGMPPEVLGRLFEPYFTTKAVGKGTGLGLSIAYSVVTEHGGWMEVESKLGQGSHFCAYFPRAQAATQPQVETSKARPESATALEGTEHILVVDDDEMVRLVVRAVLSYRGYQVLEANDGLEGVQKYSEAEPRPDLVLLDLNMPRLNGWDAMERIRLTNPKAAIVLLSGGMTEGEVDRALTSGAREFLVKPFENQDLLRAVRKVLDEAHATSPNDPQ